MFSQNKSVWRWPWTEKKRQHQDGDLAAEGKTEIKPQINHCKPLLPPAKLREFCNCPSMIDRDEWLASHEIVFDVMQLTRDYVSLLKPCKCGNMVIGGDGEIAYWPPTHSTLFTTDTLTKSTTTSSLPTMHDQVREEALPAAQYMDLSLSWLEKIIDDPHLFPVKTGATFPVDFVKNVVKPCTLTISAILEHQYACHYVEHVQTLGMTDHLGTLIMHVDAIRRECGLSPIPLVI